MASESKLFSSVLCSIIFICVCFLLTGCENAPTSNVKVMLSPTVYETKASNMTDNSHTYSIIRGGVLNLSGCSIALGAVSQQNDANVASLVIHKGGAAPNDVTRVKVVEQDVITVGNDRYQITKIVPSDGSDSSYVELTLLQ